MMPMTEEQFFRERDEAAAARQALEQELTAQQMREAEAALSSRLAARGGQALPATAEQIELYALENRPAQGSARAYSGPNPNRPVDARGRAIVSAQELADFQRQFGADKTLRDLLNADRGLARRQGPQRPAGAPAAAPAPQGAAQRAAAPVQVPGQIPGAMAGAAGPGGAPEGMSDLERNLANTLNALAPVLPASPLMARALISALRGGRGAAAAAPAAQQAVPRVLRMHPEARARMLREQDANLDTLVP